MKPEVNDYVKWNRDLFSVEGWVYFKCNEYITIEICVRPRHSNDLRHSTFHRNERTLVICYSQFYDQLEYVKSRPTVMSSTNEYFKRA